MKHVFDTDEIAHLWMNKTQDDARNAQGNFYFNGATIYSYGSHFPIARHVKNANGQEAILFTTRTYSNTTSKHLYAVRNAIPSSAKVFYVGNPSDDLPDAKNASDRTLLGNWEARIKSYSESIIEPRIRPATRTKRWESLQELVADANEFCVFFGVKPSFMLPEAIETLSAELEAERKRNEAKAKRDKAKQNRLQRERIAQERIFAGPRIAAWVDGFDYVDANGNGLSSAAADEDPEARTIRIPYSIPEAYLRIEDGEVATSKGARFPLSHARRGFAFVSAIRAKGEAWQTNGHTFHIGHYQIKSIDAQGNVIAGCHTVAWSEIERFGKLLEAYKGIERKESDAA